MRHFLSIGWKNTNEHSLYRIFSNNHHWKKIIYRIRFTFTDDRYFNKFISIFIEMNCIRQDEKMIRLFGSHE